MARLLHFLSKSKVIRFGDDVYLLLYLQEGYLIHNIKTNGSLYIAIKSLKSELQVLKCHLIFIKVLKDWMNNDKKTQTLKFKDRLLK